MKILILTSLKEPSERFGTERVAYDLARLWQKLGHHVILAGGARVGTGAPQISGEDFRVLAFRSKSELTRAAHYSRRTGPVPELLALLEADRPDVAVIVGFGPAEINISHLEELKAKRIPVALWHHVPGVTCQQHGLRYKNRELCDGLATVRRCAACRLTAAGMPELMAEASARLPSIDTAWLPGPLGHFLGGSHLSEQFVRSVGQLAETLCHTFVGADWVANVLARNGFPPAKLSVVRPGVPVDLIDKLSSLRRSRLERAVPVRFVYWGRIDDTKGIDTAIRAVRAIDAPLEFLIAGPLDKSRSFDRSLLALRGDDARIRFVGRLDPSDLAQFLLDADVAIIPSVWPETGPLTVFEAHAAKLPVLGARTGGIAEICATDESARLFERHDHEGLAALMAELVSRPSEIQAMRAHTPIVRTMENVAENMLGVLTACIRSI